MRKMSLDLDTLAVETFDTAPLGEDARGTVHANACTVGKSCYCPTAYAVCGTGPATIYSCPETNMTACDSWCTEDI